MMARTLRHAAAWTSCAVTLLLPGPAISGSSSALSEEPIPLQVDKAPKRPEPILELGSDFLGTGVIGPGFEIPTGAVWQPQLLLWGSFRTALQSFDPIGGDAPRVSEWRNRWDIFGELEVSPTERLVVGLRPMDNDGDFAGCGIEPRNQPAGQSRIRDRGCVGHWNARVQTLFIEGNIGEIFPHLGEANSRDLDLEFSAGRQPILVQDGFLIADPKIDAIALTRNNISLPGTSNTRLTAIWAWDEVNRANNFEDGKAMLGGFFVETDTPLSTINFDNVIVLSNQDAGNSIHGGVSFIQRLGKLSTAFRALYSYALDGDTPEADTGGLFFGELIYVPPYTHNNLYLNGFFGIERFSSAARGRSAGGPLGATGLLFGAPGIGLFGAPLGNDVDRSYGGALGYQIFFAHNRRQLTLEAGARGRYRHSGARPSFGIATSFQQAFGRRIVARVEGFVGSRSSFDIGWGARSEILLKY